jgi:serine protease Do
VQDGRSGAGSGVVWSADGAIVTNAHVVHHASPSVVLSDGRRFDARIVRRDQRRDLALLQIDVAGLHAATPRRDPAVRVGEVLVALGHPLGVANALTMGIAHVSAEGIDDRFVQADLRLAPGNSGGPLADVNGRIVGINSMVVDGGLALAVPTAAVEDFVGLASAPGPLGVVLAAARIADGSQVAVVTAVAPGSRAERAGLLVGDVLAARDVARQRFASSVAVRRAGLPIVVALPRDPASVRAA